MTAMELRRAFVARAMAWLGRKESNGSHREIIDVYNSIVPLPNGYHMSYSDPWCAAFVSAVAWLCGLTKSVFPNASCPRMVELYKAAGRWKEDDSYMPRLGDIVFYDWEDSGSGDNIGNPDHVGIVCEIFSNSFNVIEGNKSDAVQIRTMKRNGRYIRGFGLPDFDAAADPDEIVAPPPAVEIPVTEPTDFSLSYHILRKGAGMDGLIQLRGEVQAVQQMLIARGYTCGGCGDDGEFGSGTDQSVRNYQIDNGLEVDGVVGPATRAKLEGVAL